MEKMVRSSRLAKKEMKSYSIQAVEKALNVLEAFGECDGEVGATHLSEVLGINKSNVFRLLATFERRGYVEREGGSGKYRLGLTAYEIGQKFLSRMDLLKKAKPVMEQLAREHGEAVYFVVNRGATIFLLDMVDTMQQVAIKPLVGKSYPLGCTAAGRVILTFSDYRNIPGIFPGFSEQERNLVRRTGIGLDREGFGEGTVSLAVPLFNAKKEIPGCLCLVGPECRLSQERIELELIPSLKHAGQLISSKMGYFEHLFV